MCIRAVSPIILRTAGPRAELITSRCMQLRTQHSKDVELESLHYPRAGPSYVDISRRTSRKSAWIGCKLASESSSIAYWKPHEPRGDVSMIERFSVFMAGDVCKFRERPSILEGIAASVAVRGCCVSN